MRALTLLFRDGTTRELDEDGNAEGSCPCCGLRLRVALFGRRHLFCLACQRIVGVLVVTKVREVAA